MRLRSALILDYKVPVTFLDQIAGLPEVMSKSQELIQSADPEDSKYIDFIPSNYQVDEILKEFPLNFNQRWGLFCTRLAEPHQDSALYDYTIGFVITGNHHLFTGRNKLVGDLTAGTCYLLENRKTHGAKPRETASPDDLLLFATQDFYANDIYDAYDKIITKLNKALA